MDQSEILNGSQVEFITLFLGGAQLCCAFYHPRQAPRIWCRKTNFLSWTDFDIFAINFAVWSHILSTVGDVLMQGKWIRTKPNYILLLLGGERKCVCYISLSNYTYFQSTLTSCGRIPKVNGFGQPIKKYSNVFNASKYKVPVSIGQCPSAST